MMFDFVSRMYVDRGYVYGVLAYADTHRQNVVLTDRFGLTTDSWEEEDKQLKADRKYAITDDIHQIVQSVTNQRFCGSMFNTL